MPEGKFYHIIGSAPVILIFSILFGVAFAVGHHVFYNSLDGHDTPSSQYNVVGTKYSISGQQINVSAGTVLAFLTNYWLSFAVSTAFQQVAWRKLRQQSSELGTIDHFLEILDNGLLCFLPSLWRRFSYAMLIAIVFWLLPVASFITPATLTVHMKGILTSQMQLVPRVDFTSMNFAFIPATEGLAPSYEYEGPRSGVQKTVTLALTDGAIQPISPPQANATWELNFNGPALTCQAVNASFYQQVVDNIYDSMQARNPACGISYAYISWTRDSSMANGSLPFSNATGTYTLRSSTVGPKGDDFYADDGEPYPTDFPPLSIYVAALPNMQSGLINSGCGQGKTALANATIVECSLYNATYASNFTYVNGVQTINTKLPLQHINDVGYIGGAVGEYPLGLAYANGTSIKPVTPQDYNTTLVEMFAYQSVMDSFGEIMVGTVANTLTVESALASSLTATDTSVMTTTFLQSNELAFLQSANEGSELSADDSDWPGDSITISQNGTIALKDALEQAFRNITLSLIAEHTLQPNMSSPYAPGMVNVTVTNYADVYSYSKQILWTAYGIGISLALLCVIRGIIAFVANGHRTFNTNFSTILRTTHDAPLTTKTDGKIEHVQIHDEDRDGKSPLPPYLKRAEVSLSRNDYASIRHDGVDEIEMNDKGVYHDITSYEGGSSSRL